MANYNIKAGDVVYLNSGSPPLTVVFNDYNTVHVTWMGYNGLAMRDSFPADCLTTTDPNKSTEPQPQELPPEVPPIEHPKTETYPLSSEPTFDNRDDEIPF